MSLKSCSFCRKQSRSLTKSLCPTCYARFQRNGTAEYVRPVGNLGVRSCSYCESKDGPFIKSLCRACYQRQYKNGSVDRVRVRNLCEVDGCNEPAISNRLCNKHRQRFARHGSVDAGRPDGWGAKSAHTLHERWKSMRRGSRGNVVERWNDFWAFVADMGDAPSPLHRIYRSDQSKPYGPDNCNWREPVLTDAKARDDGARYMREYNRKAPHVFKRAYLKRHYGVSLEWYEEVFRVQDGVCAICKQPETNRHARTGKPVMLAVDHDHLTGKPRGLLCSAHNTGLGLFGDNPDTLRAAIAYLERHAGPVIDTPPEPA